MYRLYEGSLQEGYAECVLSGSHAWDSDFFGVCQNESNLNSIFLQTLKDAWLMIRMGFLERGVTHSVVPRLCPAQPPDRGAQGVHTRALHYTEWFWRVWNWSSGALRLSSPLFGFWLFIAYLDGP